MQILLLLFAFLFVWTSYALPFTRNPTTRAPSTKGPSRLPTTYPTKRPSLKPTLRPTKRPTTRFPTKMPSTRPTRGPSVSPSARPTTTKPSFAPTEPIFEKVKTLKENGITKLLGLDMRVAINGDATVMVFGDAHPGNGLVPNAFTGAVLVYTRPDTTKAWRYETTIVPSDLGNTGDVLFQIGYDAAIDNRGTTIVFSDSTLNGGNGAVWVYRKVASRWTFVQMLTQATNIDFGLEPNFGSAVTLSADAQTIVIGSQNAFDYKGCAHVFTLNEQTGLYTVLQVFQPLAITGVGARLGIEVKASADASVIVVLANHDGPLLRGAVYTYIKNPKTGMYAFVHRLYNAGGVSTRCFAMAISISADGLTLLFGHRCDRLGGGSARAYAWLGGTVGWREIGLLLGTGEGVGKSSQGDSVTMDATGQFFAVSGATDDDGNGAVWIYRRIGPALIRQDGDKRVLTAEVMGALTAPIPTWAWGKVNLGSHLAMSADGTTLAVVGQTGVVVFLS